MKDEEKYLAKGPITAKEVIEEELKGLRDKSIPAFIGLVTDEFGTIDSSDELAMVMEVTESYKTALITGKKEFTWSYTAPINEVTTYYIDGTKIDKK